MAEVELEHVSLRVGPEGTYRQTIGSGKIPYSKSSSDVGEVNEVGLVHIWALDGEALTQL